MPSRRAPGQEFPRLKGFDFICKLGQGGGGTVFLAKHGGYGEVSWVAVKRIALTQYDQTKTEENMQLHETLRGVGLLYVVPVFDIFDDEVL